MCLLSVEYFCPRRCHTVQTPRRSSEVEMRRPILVDGPSFAISASKRKASVAAQLSSKMNVGRILSGSGRSRFVESA